MYSYTSGGRGTTPTSIYSSIDYMSFELFSLEWHGGGGKGRDVLGVKENQEK